MTAAKPVRVTLWIVALSGLWVFAACEATEPDTVDKLLGSAEGLALLFGPPGVAAATALGALRKVNAERDRPSRASEAVASHEHRLTTLEGRVNGLELALRATTKEPPHDAS